MTHQEEMVCLEISFLSFFFSFPLSFLYFFYYFSLIFFIDLPSNFDDHLRMKICLLQNISLLQTVVMLGIYPVSRQYPPGHFYS